MFGGGGGGEAARLFIGVGVDDSQANKGLDNLSNKTDGFAGKLGKLGIAAAVTGGALAVAFAGKSVMAASDLNETISKANNVFGESAAEIQKWSKTSATAFGQSRTEALNAASTFGNLFVQLGTGRKESADLSKQMTVLASDFASFHNAAPTDVVDAMTAAFRGEYDAVQRYVPTINAAAVEQKALAMTGKATTKELTAQEKAMATQKLLMEGAGDAVGDFSRTQDGLANRLRIVKARAMDFAAGVGTVLIPFVLKAMDVIESLTSWLGTKLAPVFTAVGAGMKVAVTAGRALVAAFKEGDVTSNGFVGAAEQVGVALRGVVDTVRKAVDWLGGMDTVLRAAGAAFGVMGAAFVGAKIVSGIQMLQKAWVALNVAMAANPFVLIVIGIAALAAAMVVAYKKSETFRNVVDKVFAFLKDTAWPIVQSFAKNVVSAIGSFVAWWKGIWPQVTEAIGHAVNAIKAIVTPILAAVRMAWHLFGDDILNYMKITWTYISTVIGAAVNMVRSIIQTVLALINGDWGMAWEGIKGVLSAAWTAITALVTAAIGTVQAILGAIFSPIRAVWDAGWEAVTGVISGAWERIKSAVSSGITNIVTFVTGLPGRVVGALASFGGKLYSTGNAAFKEFLRGIVDMAQRLWEWAGTIAGKVVGAIGNAGKILYEVGRDIIEGLINGAKSMLGSLKSFLGDVGGWITSWKGPPSYDRVMLKGNGALIMEGLIAGLASGRDALKKELTRTTELIAGTMADASGTANVALTGSGSASMGDMALAGNNGGTSVTYSVQIADSPTEITEEGLMEIWQTMAVLHGEPTP